MIGRGSLGQQDNEAGVENRGDVMNHTILYKRKGFYGAFPVLTHLPDGRLTVGIPGRTIP